MPGAPPLVAIVDDDASIREAISNFFRSVGWSTTTFADAASFLASPERHTAACVVADVQMPGISGLEMHRQLVAAGDDIPTVLITAYPDESVRARAGAAHIVCCLAKPFAPEELLQCVGEALANGRQ